MAKPASAPPEGRLPWRVTFAPPSGPPGDAVWLLSRWSHWPLWASPAPRGRRGPERPAAADLLLTNVVAGGNDTITVGGYTTVRYTLEQANGDGQNKCNVDEKHPGTLVLSAASGVSWTPEMIQIRCCKAADGVGVTFTSTTPGTYPVTVSIA